MKISVFLFLLLSFFISAASRNELWDQVEKAKRDGLPKTAVTYLEEIIIDSKKKGDSTDYVKAVVQKIILEANVEGNHPEEKIRRMNEATAEADESSAPVMMLIQARWYLQYFNRNRYRYLNRTAVEQPDTEDISSWDLRRIFSEISLIYDRIFEKTELLKKIRTSDFSGFLEEGNSDPELRPTLYDFSVSEALSFYQHDDQTLAVPEDAFTVSMSSGAGEDLEKFLQFAPDTSDRDSSLYKAVKLYQNLLRFNQDSDNIAGMLDNDIKRLLFIKSRTVDQDSEEILKKRLKKIADEYQKFPQASAALYQIGEILYAAGDFTGAYDMAVSGEKLHPDSHGAVNCAALRSRITARELQIESEDCVPPGKTALKLEFRNIDRVYFRIMKGDFSHVFDQAWNSPGNYSYEFIQKLLQQKPLSEWKNKLEPGNDYKSRTEIVYTPDLKEGYYHIIASFSPDFNEDSNMIKITDIQVTRMALVVRPRNQLIEGMAVENESGEALSGVQAEIYQRDRKGFYRIWKTIKTDLNGIFSVNPGKDRGEMLLILKNGVDQLLYSPLYQGYRSEKSAYESVLFFTDRSLYRPGQTIYFRGVAFSINHKNDEYKTLENRRIKVVFRDANWQEILRQEFITNKFGSFNGSFTAPSDRLNGAMTISSENPSGSATVRVEEYKRPKFYVELSPPDAASLGKNVTVTGKALSYTGAAVDNAVIRFQVKRKARMPFWWFWWGFDGDASPAKEILHGKLKTASDGSFSITFKAEPDQKIMEKDKPVFDFLINADCTDSAGETRSASSTVSLGYSGYELDLQIPEWLNADKQFNVSISARTLNQKSVGASGNVAVYRLLQPDKPERAALFRRRYWWFSEETKSAESDYRLWSRGEKVFETSFSCGADKKADLSLNLPAGAYTVSASAEDGDNKPVELSLPFLVFSESNSRFPVKVPCYYCLKDSSVKVGGNAAFFFGTGYEQGKAFIEVEQDGRILKSFWTPQNSTQYLFTWPVNEKLRGGFTVHSTFVRENRAYLTSKLIDVPWDNKELSVSLGTYRSVMEPGAEESWTVSITGPDAEKAVAEMAAVLYDKSLDAYYPHSFGDFRNIFRRHQQGLQLQFADAVNQFYSFRENWNSYESGITPTYWKFPDDLIQDYYGYEMMRGAVMKRSKSFAADVECDSLAAQSAPACCEAKSEEPAGGAADKEENSPVIDSEQNLDNVTARTNLNETAFFYPDLVSDRSGNVSIRFRMPDALTTWNFLACAHTADMKSGSTSAQTVTRKELMVQPNPPRFFREGDQIEISAKVTNMTEKSMTGQIRLNIEDPVSGKKLDSEFIKSEITRNFSLESKSSSSVSWKITVPDFSGVVLLKTVAASGNFSDGEETAVPVLSRRIEVRESLPLWIRDQGKKSFSFEKLKTDSDTRVNLDFTVQMASNPAWYAVRALPYLMEYPYECAEQIFNRYYANSLASFIAESDPKIRRVFDQWKESGALESNLEKNQDLKNILLRETPWVREAKSETESMHRIGLLFDRNNLVSSLENAMKKLEQMQLSDGSWPWFPGGRPCSFITLYIATGFGRLKNLGVNVKEKPALRAFTYLDKWLNEEYQDIIRNKLLDEENLSSTIALYLYGRSFFLKEKEIPQESKEALNYFLSQGEKHWLKLNNRMSQGHLALAFSRFGKKETAEKIVRSIHERSVSDEEMGMYWRDQEYSWWWYHAPIESQAVMIEMFDEVTSDTKAMEDCRVWLLKQKQTQNWKTTKATADAVYSLLLRGESLLSQDSIVKVSIGGQEIIPEKIEPGTGFYEKKYSGKEISSSFCDIELEKKDKGIAWGGAHWHYLEDMSKVSRAETDLSLQKALYLETDTKSGKVLVLYNGEKPLSVGDRLKVRIVLKTDRDMEFVHMRDMRGSGCEPEEVLSCYRYQDGLYYYQSTKDTSTDFFMDYLPKGSYVFEYGMRVQSAGEYQSGIALIQCMYAPEFSSHSESIMIRAGGQN